MILKVTYVLLCIGLLATRGNKVEKTASSPDYILCRYCGFNIAPASTILNLNSPAAETTDQHALFGLKNVNVQKLKNPLGIEFNVITSRGGTCIGSSRTWHTEDSWYPGHAWKACTCTRCQKFIGWVFEPVATATKDRVFASLKGFYALNLENVISEAYADSLIASPKF